MSFKPSRFVPLMAAGRQIGWLQPELAARLAAWDAVFRCSADKVVLLEPDALEAVLRRLAEEGFIPGWRNERYRIENLFEIERAAARPFGLATHAVHVNGISGGKMWLARRAASKAIDPGLLDNLVGGGVTAGLSLEEVLVKEAWEEAGIPGELARTARRGGEVQVLREVPEGVQSETVHVFDLALPEGFEPRNQDGEVSEYLLVDFQDVEKQDLTLEARLAAQDYFTRARVR
jgi:8-oxo-dGTP pyrophosphatase MutT (NUDIX family)